MLLPALRDPPACLPRILFPEPASQSAPAAELVKCCRMYQGFAVNGGRRIIFNDVLHMFASPRHCELLLAEMSARLIEGVEPAPTALLGVASRGYPFAAMLALKHRLKLVFARAGGKTPGPIAAQNVSLKNYGGGDALEVSLLTLGSGDRVVVLDDLLATGGSLEAAAQAVEGCGAAVSALFAFAEYRSDFGGRCVGGGRARLEALGRRVVTCVSYADGGSGIVVAR